MINLPWGIERIMKVAAGDFLAMQDRLRKEREAEQARARKQVDDDKYSQYLDAQFDHNNAVAPKGQKLFHTDADTSYLWKAYLAAAPTEAARQSRKCRTCERFVKNFGDLVVIAEDGRTHTAIWPSEAPPAYADANKDMVWMTSDRKVTGIFLSKDPFIGRPSGDGWTHFSVVNHNQFTSSIHSPHQAMQARLTEFNTLQNALSVYAEGTFRTAAQLLGSGHMDRASNHAAWASWLLDLKVRRVSHNQLWLAVANAPAGWCHVRSGVIGSVLDDIQCGLKFDDVVRNFNLKMDPMKYMRPTAPVTVGNVRQAEDLVEKMGLTKFLERRYATMEDLKAYWRPNSMRAQPTGVFSHLLSGPKPGDQSLLGSKVKMTWAKFERDVLPKADNMDVYAAAVGNYVSFVTEKHPGSPSPFQWNNPVSWFVYNGGSKASQFNLLAGSWAPVEAIVLAPTMWMGEWPGNKHRFAAFVIKGAYNTIPGTPALFPEILKSDLHPVRSTLEAHSKKTSVQVDRNGAIGLSVVDGKMDPLTVRVTAGGVTQVYEIDRWE